MDLRVALHISGKQHESDSLKVSRTREVQSSNAATVFEIRLYAGI